MHKHNKTNRTHLSIFVFSIFLFIVFSSNDFRDFAYSMAAIGIAYITIIGIAQSEYKNNSDIIINSLPTTRREIVAAKYLSVVTCTVIALLIVGAVGIPFSLIFAAVLVLGVDYLTASLRLLPRIESTLGLPILAVIPPVSQELAATWETYKREETMPRSEDS